MEILTKILDVFALAVQFIGGLMMYLNSPENRIMGAMMGGDYNMDVPKLKNKRLRYGFLILSIGILVALVTTVLKWFAPTCK